MVFILCLWEPSTSAYTYAQDDKLRRFLSKFRLDLLGTAKYAPRRKQGGRSPFLQNENVLTMMRRNNLLRSKIPEQGKACGVFGQSSKVLSIPQIIILLRRKKYWLQKKGRKKYV